jgi:predicted  nucleic acid-binding Zn-ribbon protein
MKTKTEEQLKRQIRNLQREIRELKEKLDRQSTRAMDAEDDARVYRAELDKYYE